MSEWTKENLDQLDKEITVLLELNKVYCSDLSATLNSYQRSLIKNLSPDECFRAIEHFNNTGLFMPRPAELISIVRGSMEAHSIRAWNLLLEAIRRVGPNRSILFQDIKMTPMLEFFGGNWPNICQWTIEETVWRRKEFMQNYPNAIALNGVRWFPGLHEIKNSHTYLIEPPRAVVAFDGTITFSEMQLLDKPSEAPKIEAPRRQITYKKERKGDMRH